MSTPSLPEPTPDTRSNFELHVVTRLDQIGGLLAEIHQMVSPPEARDGPTLTDVMLRLVEQSAAQTEEIGRLAAIVERIGRPAAA